MLSSLLMKKTVIVMYCSSFFGRQHKEGLVSYTTFCAIVFPPPYDYYYYYYFDISGAAYFNRSTFLLGKTIFSNAVLS